MYVVFVISLLISAIDGIIISQIRRSSLFTTNSSCALVLNVTLPVGSSIQTCIWKCDYEDQCQTGVYYHNNRTCLLFSEDCQSGNITSSGNIQTSVICHRRNQGSNNQCSSQQLSTSSTTTNAAEQRTVFLLQPSDSIVSLYNTTAGKSTGNFDGVYSNNTNEHASSAIDGNLATKYFNFGNTGCYQCHVLGPGVGTGFFVTPSISNATIAMGLIFATANDFAHRDPLTVTLEGSNATTNATLHLGSSWTLIYNGSTGIDPVFNNSRSVYVIQQNFNNTMVFASYRLLITSQRSLSNGVQYSEAQIIGESTTTNERPIVFLTRSSDRIVALYNTTAGQDTHGSNGIYLVSNEGPTNAIDGNLATKYFNFGNAVCYPCYVPEPGVGTGFFVTPSISNATIARSILFATANDFAHRDPLTVTLEGSNATTNVTLHLGSSWTLIYNGSTGIDCSKDPGRSRYVTQQNFPNTKIFASYRLLITSQRSLSDGVQYSEAQILGYV
ncbi:unnamed protein product [Adineta ricciae]|uniref:Apple domain-containing protein n=1 Tax=Adineta ricciae TaxID=249248 RepID=A0A816FD68_ADIRI|nr:unnamed protein product [Adineta ricciae]